MNAVKTYGIACKNVALSTHGKVATSVMLLAANSAFAQETESAIQTAINAAKSTALSNVGLAVGAVIAVAALVMGIGVVLGLIKR
jgi:hypothetical protein